MILEYIRLYYSQSWEKQFSLRILFPGIKIDWEKTTYLQQQKYITKNCINNQFNQKKNDVSYF